MEHLPSVRGIVAGLAAVLVAASLAGCMEFLDMASLDDPASGDGPSAAATTSATVRVAGPLTVASAKGGHADIASVTVSVAGENSQGIRQDPLATASLSQTHGVWTGTLTGLTVGKELDFAAEALDSGDVAIFRGTHTATLGGGGEQITITLSAINGTGNAFPTVTAITVGPVAPGATADVEVTVRGSDNESLPWRFAGGTFTPASGSVALTGGSGTFTSSYQAPEVVGQYLVRVAVGRAQGHRVEVDFRIRVEESSSPGSASTISARIGPAVQGLSGRRTPAGIRWNATLSSSGDETGLVFAWTFTGANRFVDAATNPAILASYDESTTGTVAVTVTDSDGLSTTARLALTAGMFPNALKPPVAELVINEIDYDTPGSDDAEFVEIYNPGSAAVDLTAYRVELVNGAGGAPYASYAGTGQLAGGGFFVIADSGVISTIPVELDTSGVQNGPDGIRIIEVATKRVVDAVYYKGRVPGSGEGSPAPSDRGTASTSIGRCANGFDSDDNGLDFRTMTATPGAANTCS